MSSIKTLLPLLVAASILVCLSQAFVISSSSRSYSFTRQQPGCNGRAISAFELSAKKKRRRRKKGGAASSPANERKESVEETTPTTSMPSMDSNELPDFDLDVPTTDDSSSSTKRRDVNPEEITANMMSSGKQSSRTINELIADRSVESRFEFEEKGDPSIPDFVDLARASSTQPSYDPNNALSSAGIGTKKARQAERIARAIERKEAEEPAEYDALFAKYFPWLYDEKGNFSMVKVLENGGT